MGPMIFSRTDLPGIHGHLRDCTGSKAFSKLGEGDIAVVRAPDMSRGTAQKLVDARVGAVVNIARFTTGNVPNFGPHMLLDAGVVLVEDAGEDILEYVRNGKKARVYEGKVWYGERSIGGGTVLDEDTAVERFDDAREALGDHMEALAGNTAEFVRTEAPLLIDGLGIPDVAVDMDDRKVLVVAPAPDFRDRLRSLRNFIREYDPVIIAVGAAADDLMKAGYRPRVIVGDPEVIGTEALRSGATVILPAEPDGHAHGLERIQDLGVGAMTFPAASNEPTDLALLLAEYHGASMVVLLGEHMDLEHLFDEDRSRDTPSALLSRLKVGGKLVDADAVAELYRVSRSGGGWIWAVLAVLVAVVVVVLIAGFSGDGGFADNLIDSWNNFAIRMQSLFS
ncbi:putative cytokinetic ring protein SteA [Corynebacterium bovis]|uniref:putative cytokinetic ring protein SteA n=1 Tax=Corynebacterium bovis TaxID=36808 RepID=UPI003139B87B